MVDCVAQQFASNPVNHHGEIRRHRVDHVHRDIDRAVWGGEILGELRQRLFERASEFPRSDLRVMCQKMGVRTNSQKARIIQPLRHDFPLHMLLRAAKMKSSSYHYARTV